MAHSQVPPLPHSTAVYSDLTECPSFPHSFFPPSLPLFVWYVSVYRSMFKQAAVFDQDISNWNVSSVIDMG